MLTVTNTVQQLYLPCCRGCFLSHRRNAGRRVWGAWGQPACHCLLECLLLYFDVAPFPICVCTTRRAEDHLWCPPHLLSLRDIRSALHLPSLDYWAECECSVKQTEDLKFQRLVFFLGETDVDCTLCSPADLQLDQGQLRKWGHPL